MKISKLAVLSVAMTLSTFAFADEVEKVLEADAEPKTAEITLNPEYKDKADKIADESIIDNEVVLDAEISQPKQEVQPALSEYKGSYGGSIRSIRPKKVEVSDEIPNADSKKDEVTTLEAEKPAEETQIAEPVEPVVENNDEVEVKNEETEIAQTEPESEESTEEEIPEIVPSRTVTMKNSQYLEVTYPGKGWSFIGDDESKELMSFMGRKLNQEDTIFTLRSKKSGETLLHFYKNDALTGTYIDDYLLVNVTEEIAQGAEKKQKVIAPPYAEFVPQKPNRNREVETSENELKDAFAVAAGATEIDTKEEETEKTVEKPTENSAVTSLTEEKLKTNIQPSKTEQKVASSKKETTAKPQPKKEVENVVSENASETKPLVVDNASADTDFTNIKEVENQVATEDMSDLFNRAKKAFEEKKYEEALSLAQKYLDIATDDTDEVLYLLGQIWESDSEVRNIKSSIDSYNSLVKNFPTSSLWRKANQRVVYLKRFYVDIR